MHRLLPASQARKLPVSKAEAAGKAALKLDQDDRLDITNAAKYLQITYPTLKDQVDRGRIPSVIIGKTTYIERADLVRLRSLLEVYGGLALALKAEEARHKKGYLLEEHQPYYNEE